MHRSFRLFFSSATVLGLIFSGVGVASAAPIISTIARTIATSGPAVADRAVSDLRNCIATTGVLNVYLLVDDSGSLYDPEGTDPSMVRAQILGNTVEQLGNLTAAEGQSPIQVNYGMGFFSQNFTDSIGWTSLTAENAGEQKGRVESEIQNSQSRTQSWTHWDTALYNAQAKLAEKAQESGCQALIWFTDGGINIDGDAGQTIQALANVCGQPVAGAAPQRGTGTLHEMRQAGVSVFGVLFNARPSPDDAFARDYFAPLIEGVGSVQGEPASCGTGAIGPNEAGGEVIVATDVDALATEFMKLGAYIGGGQPSTGLSETGEFTIDAGVSSFRLIVNAPASVLTLQAPSGPLDLTSAPGLTVTPYANATEISFTPQSKLDFGQWKLSGADSVPKALIIFGGLTINPDPANSITLGSDAELTFEVGTVFPDLLAVEDYSYNLEIRQTDENGQVKLLTTLPGSTIRPGSNVATVHPLEGQSLAKIWFVATKVETATGKQPLSEVRSYQEISALVPGVFPTISPLTLDLGVLSGNSTPATGSLTVNGPTSADSGQVCLPEGEFRPVIKTDTVDRLKTWKWTIVASGSNTFVDNCLTVKTGTAVTLTISALNSTSAQSVVQGYMPLITKSFDGQILPQTINFSLTSERKIDPEKFVGVIAVLVLLGLLLPLLALYLVNLMTTKVEYGDLLRASFDAQFNLKNDEVTVQSKDFATSGVKLSAMTSAQEAFRGLPPQSDGPTISDSEVGSFRRQVPLLPFRSPWFEIVAPAGSVVLTGTSPRITQERRYKLGRRAPFTGQVSRTWVVVIREDVLTRDDTETVNGRIVIFDKRGRGGSDRPKLRLIEVQHEMRLSKRLEALRAALKAKAEKPEKVSKRDLQGGKEKTASSDAVLPPPPPGSSNSGSNFSSPPSRGPGLGTPPSSPSASPPRSLPPSGPAQLPPPPPG
jgi:hypothetical protein